MLIFQSVAQENNLTNWLQLIPLLAIIGGLISFIIWDRRKKSLELEKLRLEIEQLKKDRDSRIYTPTSKEIEQILKNADFRDDISSMCFISMLPKPKLCRDGRKFYKKTFTIKELASNKISFWKIKRYNHKPSYSDLKRKKYYRKTKFPRRRK